MSDQKKEMTQEREIAILEGAIKKFGYREQVIVAIEDGRTSEGVDQVAA